MRCTNDYGATTSEHVVSKKLKFYLGNDRWNKMSENKPQNAEHRRLVKALIEELKRQGFEITNAEFEGYQPCPEVEELVPTVKGYNRKKEYVVFGVAATCDELGTQQTEDQFKMFSSRFMRSGKSHGAAAPFCIAISKGCEKQLETCLKTLQLDRKKNIFLYAF